MHRPEETKAKAEDIRTDLGDGVSRRQFLGAAGSAALALSAVLPAGLAAQQADEVRKGEAGHSASNAGPENTAIQATAPDSFLPPPTDKGDVPTFWYSFSLAKRRVQEGGWARQVNVKDLPLAKEIAAVNMRLTAGGIRELHWHAAGEWSLMLSGNARLTALDDNGLSYVNDIKAGDLWYFPAGNPHSIQGLGPDGCEFLLVFDDGSFSEFDTTLLSDWLAHAPKSVVAKNFGVSEEALVNLPKEELYIFQTPIPGALEVDRMAARRGGPASPVRFDYPMLSSAPDKKDKSGEVRIVDSRKFPISTTIAMAHVTLKPGGIRELHWHQNSDEWQYWISGKGRMTLFYNSAKARTMDFNPGDVGYVPKTLGHYIENTGDTDLVFIEMFKAPQYKDLSLNDWVTHIPPELAMQHLRISRETLDAIPAKKLVTLPG